MDVNLRLWAAIAGAVASACIAGGRNSHDSSNASGGQRSAPAGAGGASSGVTRSVPAGAGGASIESNDTSSAGAAGLLVLNIPSSAGASGAPGEPLFCPTGLLLCDASCVDVATNPLHCGRCGERCGVKEQCVGGSCWSLATGAGGHPGSGGLDSAGGAPIGEVEGGAAPTGGTSMGGDTATGGIATGGKPITGGAQATGGTATGGIVGTGGEEQEPRCGGTPTGTCSGHVIVECVDGYGLGDGITGWYTVNFLGYTADELSASIHVHECNSGDWGLFTVCGPHGATGDPPVCIDPTEEHDEWQCLGPRDTDTPGVRFYNESIRVACSAGPPEPPHSTLLVLFDLPE